MIFIESEGQKMNLIAQFQCILCSVYYVLKYHEFQVTTLTVCTVKC